MLLLLPPPLLLFEKLIKSFNARRANANARARGTRAEIN
jgi:hypothetical protein